MASSPSEYILFLNCPGFHPNCPVDLLEPRASLIVTFSLCLDSQNNWVTFSMPVALGAYFPVIFIMFELWFSLKFLTFSFLKIDFSIHFVLTYSQNLSYLSFIFESNYNHDERLGVRAGELLPGLGKALSSIITPQRKGESGEEGMKEVEMEGRKGGERLGGREGEGGRKSKRMNTYFDPHSPSNIFRLIK